MVQYVIHDVKLECLQGDIADQQDVDAVVNAANAQLTIGGGVAGAIHRAAGKSLEEECREYAPINPGEAVITDGHNLPNEYVIHCLGPVYGRDEPSDDLLATCYTNALDLAEENAIASIAFPALSTGAFGYPMEPAAQIALSTIIDKLPELFYVEHIRFVLYSESALEVHERVLDELSGTN